jgi:hypothetical protein
MHFTLSAVPAKQAQVIEPESSAPSGTLGRQHSMIATIETASSETLHSKARYHDTYTRAANNRQNATRRPNLRPVMSRPPQSAFRRMAQTEERLAAIFQCIPTKHAVDAHTTRSMPVPVERQNPHGFRQGFGLATYAEHGRYRREVSRKQQPLRITARPDTVTLPTKLAPPSPTSTTVCGAEQSSSEDTATEAGAVTVETGKRPWSEDVWMQVARK